MNEPLDAALVVASDRAASGERPDASAPLLAAAVAAFGFRLAEVVVVPDERPAIAATLRDLATRHALVLTTGGTGVGPRDRTPEATRDAIDLEVPGLGEAMRAAGLARTPHAVGSRALGGFLGRALVLNLPGRPAGAVESLEAVGPALRHLVAVRRGPVADREHGAERDG